MTTVRLDRVDTLEVKQRYNVINYMKRRARVLGVTNTDYTALMQALADAGVPAYGSRPTDAANLILVERNAVLYGENVDVVDVDLIYEPAWHEGQNMDQPPFSLAFAEMQVSLNQVSTNLDKDGNTIVLKHTYPADDPDYPNIEKEQGGEIQFFQAQPTLKVQGIKSTNAPWLLARSLVGSINAGAWGGGGEGTWMCTSASWKNCDIGSGPNRYFFTFEFQFNPDGWNPTAVFVDDRTGKPPVDLVKDVGYKTIKKHPEVSFDGVLGVRVQGG